MLEGIDSIREKIRIRDNHTCQKCGKVWKKGRRFDVHHLDHRMESNRNYAYDRKNLDKMVTLCHKCHLNLPHLKKKFRNNPALLKRNSVLHKLAIQKKKKMMVLWKSGKRQEEIAELYGISSQRVGQLLRAYKKDHRIKFKGWRNESGKRKKVMHTPPL